MTNGAVGFIGLRLAGLAAVGMAAASLRAQGARSTDSLVAREQAYARAIESFGDSAIRRLDFFPASTQLRVQTAFSDGRAPRAVNFSALRERSAEASLELDEIIHLLETTLAPEDLSGFHRSMLEALRRAEAGLTHLARASAGCESSPGSLQHCQSPFTAASSEVAGAYGRYLAVRNRIREQIIDTGTLLAEFKPRS